MARAMEYMYPFMLDKKKWPLPPDVMYFDRVAGRGSRACCSPDWR